MAVSSLVLAFPPGSAAQSLDYLAAKLSYYADAWDVAEDLRNGVSEILVIDTRAEALYVAGHIPGAISLPHRLMNEAGTAHLDRDKVYVTYCDGIGCNGSTKGAYKLAQQGLRVKELIGGLDFWIRDGHPVATGEKLGLAGGKCQWRGLWLRLTLAGVTAKLTSAFESGPGQGIHRPEIVWEGKALKHQRQYQS